MCSLVHVRWHGLEGQLAALNSDLSRQTANWTTTLPSPPEGMWQGEFYTVVWHHDEKLSVMTVMKVTGRLVQTSQVTDLTEEQTVAYLNRWMCVCARVFNHEHVMKLTQWACRDSARHLSVSSEWTGSRGETPAAKYVRYMCVSGSAESKAKTCRPRFFCALHKLYMT